MVRKQRLVSFMTPGREGDFSIVGDARDGRPIYLDMQATTPMDPRVVDAMLPYMTGEYGNPHSRTHEYGWEAESAVEEARKVVQSRSSMNADRSCASASRGTDRCKSKRDRLHLWSHRVQQYRNQRSCQAPGTPCTEDASYAVISLQVLQRKKEAHHHYNDRA